MKQIIKINKKEKKMDAVQLAEKMLSWRKLIEAAAKIEDEIKEAVLEIGKTQTVGGVRASYSGGRKSYDYETPAQSAPKQIIDIYTKTVVDWRAVCKNAGIEPIVVAKSPPSVSLKIVKEK